MHAYILPTLSRSHPIFTNLDPKIPDTQKLRTPKKIPDSQKNSGQPKNSGHLKDSGHPKNSGHQMIDAKVSRDCQPIPSINVLSSIMSSYNMNTHTKTHINEFPALNADELPPLMSYKVFTPFCSAVRTY